MADQGPHCEPTLVMENVQIVFRNFAGKEGPYNAEGDRNFGVLLDEKTADHLNECGYNVKYLKPREEDDGPQAYLQISFKYRGRDGRMLRPPRVVMITSRGKTELHEDEVEMLDWVDMQKADIVVRPREWEVQGKTGIKAYLQSCFVTVNEDPLELKYAEVDDASRS